MSGRNYLGNPIFTPVFLLLTLLFPTLLWAAAGDKKWSISLGNAIFSSPAIGTDGTIYVGSSDGGLYAVNPDGTIRWTFKTNASVLSSPAVGSDGTIYVGSDDRKFYAVNPDGSQKWFFAQASQAISSSPAISSSGTLYVGSEDSKLYAVTSDGNTATGQWPFFANGPITASPAVFSDGTIYFGTEFGKLYAITSTGEKKWNTLPQIRWEVSTHLLPWIRTASSILAVMMRTCMPLTVMGLRNGPSKPAVK